MSADKWFCCHPKPSIGALTRTSSTAKYTNNTYCVGAYYNVKAVVQT